MTTQETQIPHGVLGDMQANSGTAIWSGALLIFMGLLAIAAPAIAGEAITILVGVALIAGGLGQSYMALRVGLFAKGLIAFVLGVLTAVVGAWLMLQPVAGLAALTLVLAGFFIAAGVLEFIAAFALRPGHGWGWMFGSAVLSFVLGILIWQQFPVSGTWALGTLFGLRLLMSGWMLLFLGLNGRKLATGL